MNFYEFISEENKIVRVEALISVSILISLTLFGLDSFFKQVITHFWLRIFFYSILLSIWIFYWLYENRKLPKNKDKDKLGIIFLIETESEKQKIRLKSDFFNRIKKQIEQNDLDGLVNPVLATNHQAQKLIPFLEKYKKHSNKSKSSKNPEPIPETFSDNWNQFREKTNGHLYIWGQIRERKHKSLTYFIEISTLLVHPPLENKQQQQLSEDMNLVWSPLIYFLEEAEYEGFAFSADLVLVASKFIVGIASFIAGDPLSAIKLHENLLNEIDIFKANPNLPKIKKRLKRLISEEYAVLTTQSIYNNEISSASELIEKSLSFNSNNYSAHLQLAIIQFSFENNPNKALKTIRKIKSFAGNDGTWRYSEAFLLMYLGEIKKSLSMYDQIIKNAFDGELFIVNQVIEFNKNYVITHPSFSQSYFIVGLLFCEKVGNYPEAIEYIEKCLSEIQRIPKHTQLIEKAETLKLKIKSSMKI